MLSMALGVWKQQEMAHLRLLEDQELTWTSIHSSSFVQKKIMRTLLIEVFFYDTGNDSQKKNP